MATEEYRADPIACFLCKFCCDAIEDRGQQNFEQLTTVEAKTEATYSEKSNDTETMEDATCRVNDELCVCGFVRENHNNVPDAIKDIVLSFYLNVFDSWDEDRSDEYFFYPDADDSNDSDDSDDFYYSTDSSFDNEVYAELRRRKEKQKIEKMKNNNSGCNVNGKTVAVSMRPYGAGTHIFGTLIVQKRDIQHWEIQFKHKRPDIRRVHAHIGIIDVEKTNRIKNWNDSELHNLFYGYSSFGDLYEGKFGTMERFGPKWNEPSVVKVTLDMKSNKKYGMLCFQANDKQETDVINVDIEKKYCLAVGVRQLEMTIEILTNND